MSSNRKKRDKQRETKSIKDAILRFCIRTILVSLGLAVLGIFVIAHNDDVIFWVIKALGLILIIDSAIRFTKFFTQKKDEREISFDVFRGTISGGVGLVSLVWPSVLETALFIFIGVIILVEGAMQLQLAFNRRRELDTWLPNFFIGLISAIIGLVIVVHPLYASAITDLLSIMFGIFIFVTALMNLFASYNLLQMRKRLSARVVNVDADDD